MFKTTFDQTPMFGAQMFKPQMFGSQMFGSQMFSPQMFGGAMGQGMPPAWTAWNQGLGDIARAVAEYSKQAFDDGTNAYRQLMSAKSMEEAMEIQSSYLQRSTTEYFQHVQKIGGMYASLGQEALKSANVTFPGTTAAR